MSYIPTKSGFQMPAKYLDLEKKESLTGHLLYERTMGTAVWPDRNYASFAKTGYIENVIVYRCINMIVSNAAAVPLFVRQGKKDYSMIDKHPFIDLLRKPNPHEGTIELLERLYSFLYIAGNSYLEAVTVRQNTPIELWVWRPDRTKVKADARGYPAEYIYNIGGQEVSYTVDFSKSDIQKNILHLKFFHPINDWYGLSPIEPVLKSIATHNEAAAYNKSLLQNQAKPSGLLIYEGVEGGDNILQDKQYKRLQQEIEAKFTGTHNAGKPMLLEGGFKWQSLSMTQEELEFLESKNSVAREIALGFGVPPMLLGIPGDNTFANYKEANRAFHRQTVLPLVDRGCKSMSSFFQPSYGEDFYLQADVDKVEALSEERADAWNRVNTSTFLTINEKREELNFKPVEGGDVVLVPSSSVSLEDIGFEGGGEEPDDIDDKPTEEETEK
jgi:HK97 family phage portal protein